MFHKNRTWCVTSAESAEELAEKLTQHSWTLCTAFHLSGYFFLNDSISEDGAQEFAIAIEDGGRFFQVESITFGWCSETEGLNHIREVTGGGYAARGKIPVSPKVETADKHGTCPLCA